MAKQWTLEETILLGHLYPDEQVTPTQMKEIFQCSWPTITGKAKRQCLRRAPIYEGRNGTCKVQITSGEMIEDLSKYNIVPNKTHTYTWPQLLPHELAMPFLLGYFDGDGSLSQYSQKKRKYWQWQLVGTQPFLSVAQEYIQFHSQVEIREPRRCDKDRSPYLYLIYASAQETIRRIDQALNASGLGLPRKHFLQ